MAMEERERTCLGIVRGLREEGAKREEETATRDRVCGAREGERKWSEAAIVSVSVEIRFI